MVFVPFGEWLPDRPAFANPGALTATNVVPLTTTATAQGASSVTYGPFGQPVPITAAVLMSRCLGSYSFKDPGGNAYNFAGDAGRLYLYDASTTGFSDVSKGAGGPYGLGSDPFGAWDATAFGDRIIFTDYVDPIQTYLVGTDSAFSDLAATTAPKARYCATIRDFLMVGNTNDAVDGPQPRRVWWPAIGNPTNWPVIGSNAAIEVQSDQQDLEQTDIGAITGLVGNGLLGADGAAYCERGIYRIAYVGSPAIFDFAVAQGGIGTKAPRSIVQSRGIGYSLGEDGFYAFDGSSPSIPIGYQKIDNTFLADLDPSYATGVQGVASPSGKLIIWAYAGQGNTGGLFNRLLIYNWAIARWSLIDLTGLDAEWLTATLTLGYTLDELDPFCATSGPVTGIDSLPYSLDSPYWTGGRDALSLFTSSHHLAYAAGANLAPTIDTAETQPFPGRRAKVAMTRIIADGAGASIAIGTRNNIGDAVSFGAAVTANSIGWCPQRTTGRYLRARLTLPPGTAFTQLQGLDVELKPEGRLR